MYIPADYHLHSAHSGDTDTPMEEMILQGIRLGLSHLCFTEHNDFDFPDIPCDPVPDFILKPKPYFQQIAHYREKYAGKIHILAGVELGMQTQSATKNAQLAASYPFDFIIASTHICLNEDPYYPYVFEMYSEEEVYRAYFDSIAENIQLFDNFDVYGHLDYIVRYGPNKDLHYSFEKYSEPLEEALRLLIAKGKGIEINTGGIKSGVKDFHPCTALLKRYRELGGEIITFGSDAHVPGQLTAHFDAASEHLKACGFKYYTIFEERKPTFIPLQ